MDGKMPEAGPADQNRPSQCAGEEEELERIYAACDKILPQPKPGPGFRTWDGQDAKDFSHLSIYAGLKISGICLFDVPKRLDGNDVFCGCIRPGSHYTLG